MELTLIESSKIESGAIPENVYVPCPAKSFANRKAAKVCPPCEFFKGLVAVQDPPTWPGGYRIFCGHPITRRVILIDEE